jgi:hypothetical protein
MRRAHDARSRVRGLPRRMLAAPMAISVVLVVVALTGCAALRNPVPSCSDPQRLAIIAQSVPGAAYIPCIRGLPPGWSTSAFNATQDGTSFLLNSDRSPGNPVTVHLTGTCRLGRASPLPPRAPGVRTYTRLFSISPRVAGVLYDVFPGGCVSYRFDFAPGPNIALTEQFENAVGLYSRLQLRLDLKNKLGVELNP